MSRAEDDAWADLVARLEATESLPDGAETLPDDAVPGSGGHDSGAHDSGAHGSGAHGAGAHGAHPASPGTRSGADAGTDANDTENGAARRGNGDHAPGNGRDGFLPHQGSPHPGIGESPAGSRRPLTDRDHTPSGSSRPSSAQPSNNQATGAPGSTTPPTGPRDWEAAEDDSDFVPPDPGPVLAGDPRLVIGWVLGAGLPPLLLALAIFLPGRVPAIVWVLLVAGSIGSWLYLVWRLPRERHDDGDDGARV